MKAYRSVMAILAATSFIGPHSDGQVSAGSASSQIEKADRILDLVITDSRSQHVGKITELAVDLQLGRVVEVLVDTKGFLTSNRRIVAVPPECFSLAPTGRELYFNGDLDAFEGAPEFDMSAWDDSTRGDNVADVFKRFHIQPYLRTSFVDRASKITGLTVQGQSGRKLGSVAALTVVLPGGSIPEILIGSSPLLADRDEYTAVPPQAFLFNVGRNGLTLGTTAEAFKNAPHFKAEDWRSALGGARSASMDSSNASSKTDAVITSEIQHKILLAEGLSIDAREVLVTARAGRVTLRGTADSEKEKQKVGEIAATVVPADHVDNRIVVKLFADGD